MLDICYGGPHGLLYLTVLNDWFFKFVKNEKDIRGSSVGALVFFIFQYYKENVPVLLFEIIDEFIKRVDPINALWNYDSLLSFVKNDILKNDDFLKITFIQFHKLTGYDFSIQSSKISCRIVIDNFESTPNKKVWDSIKETCCCVPKFAKPFDGFYSYKMIESNNIFHITNDIDFKRKKNCLYIDKKKICDRNCLLQFLKKMYICYVNDEYIFYEQIISSEEQ